MMYLQSVRQHMSTSALVVKLSYHFSAIRGEISKPSCQVCGMGVFQHAFVANPTRAFRFHPSWSGTPAGSPTAPGETDRNALVGSRVVACSAGVIGRAESVVVINAPGVSTGGQAVVVSWSCSTKGLSSIA